jgi:hypothetical protein
MEQRDEPRKWGKRSADWWASIMPRCFCAECPKRGIFRAALHTKQGGHFFEGHWYCSSPCLRTALKLRVCDLLSGAAQERPRVHRFPIGLVLVNRRIITPEQLHRAVVQQREAQQGRLGEWLCRLDFINEQQLTSALAYQWGCPTYPLERQPIDLALGNLVPFKILESACAVLAHVSADSATVHLAFGERLDFTTLYAVERMLERRAIASVARTSSVKQVLEHLRQANPSQDPTFDSVRDPDEISRIISSYALELVAARVSIARAANYIWVRFHRKQWERDLLFRIHPLSRAVSPSNVQVPSKVLPETADRRKDGVSNAATLR